MTNIPSVSVIVPMYKVERYIKKCVDSILAQTFQDFEIILVDDASPDGCVELCQKLYGDNEKVRLVRHEKNLGLGPARNTGMKHAVGKYIYFVDSDDYLLPAALEKFFDAAEKTNAQVVQMSGRYNLVENDDAPEFEKNLQLKWDGFDKEVFLPNDVIYRLEKHWKNSSFTWPTAWVRFCRRDFLEKNHIEFLDIISEDVTFSFALFCLAERYYILREAQYVHLMREGSIMRTNDTKRLSDGIYAMLVGATYIEKIIDTFPKFDGYDAWREDFMTAFFYRYLNNHTAKLYSALKITSERNAAAEKILSPVFGKNLSFVKYFFNQFHLYRRQSELLAAQNRYLNKIAADFVNEHDALSKIIFAAKADGKKIFLLGSPLHGNLGDHAIALGEMHVLKKFFPDREIIDVPVNYLVGENLWVLGFEKFVRRDDIFALIGGGNLGNLWLDNERARRMTIEKFPRNKIVIFPQSIHFTDDAAGRKELAVSQKIYNAHGDLHLMTRDENSFNLAKKIFPAVKNYLLPDTATVLQGIVDDVDVERKGVLFVLRRDKEKVRDDKTITRLQNYLTAKNIPFTVTDTVIREKVGVGSREQKVRDVLLKIRSSKLVVTDRFHGVIFSFITRTPVLAFKSFDTKISSGIKWFKNFPSIFYAESQDWSSVEKFIDENYSAVEEKNSVALNRVIDADAEGKFFDALKKIVRSDDDAAGKKKNRLTISAVKISARRLTFNCNVQGNWKKFFTGAEFYIEYNVDVSRTPKDIAVIPFLCNVLPLAWILDAEIVVDKLDYDFHAHLPEIKRGYVGMYPRIKFGGKLTVGKLIRHDYEVGDETAAFFSGGLDSFDTLIAHAPEHPTLITLFGSDVKLTDIKGCRLVQKHAIETARQFGCKNLLIASTFRRFLNGDLLSKLVRPLANDGWWHGFQHGIGIIGHAAPYAYLHRLKKIYMASSFSPEYKNYTCASDPSIDNHVRIGKCVTVHDDFQFNRQDKIDRICNFKRRTGIPIHLRVCWRSLGGKNCCACEKCYRTICGILAQGENPADFGFDLYSSDTLEKMRRDFQKPDFKYRQLTWQLIQARFRERSENLPKNLSWLPEMNF